jgi:hypothetical protein
MRAGAPALVVVVALAGCGGVIAPPGGRAGVDGSAGADAGDPGAGPDGAPARDAPCADDAGADARAPDAAADRDATSCVSGTCVAHASCVGGECRCDPGYLAAGGVCAPLDPGDPAGRTAAEVCDRWRADYPPRAASDWAAGPAECDPGTLDDAARDDAVRRISLHRWLAGLGPVTRDDPAADAAAQQCALMLWRNGQLDHSPPSTWTCYSAEGAAMAGSSNEAMGYAAPADAIDGYLCDQGALASMGHRLWVLHPSYGRAAVGHADAYDCLHVMDGSGQSPSRPFVAYPSPGPFPAQAAPAACGNWTFISSTVTSASAAHVRRRSTGADLPVTTVLTSGSFVFGPAVAFRLDESVVGETYEVTVTGLTGGDVAYAVTIVDCG